MKLKLINQKSFWWGVLAALIGVLIANFIYNNIIIPWPYREALQNCLSEIHIFDTQDAIDDTRSQCFRTYPHFN